MEGNNMFNAFDRIGKELQRPEQRRQEKEQCKERAEKLKHDVNELSDFFNKQGADSQKINNIQAISNTVATSLQAINSWEPIVHSNENKDQILATLTHAEQQVAPLKQEMQALEKQQASKPAGP